MFLSKHNKFYFLWIVCILSLGCLPGETQIDTKTPTPQQLQFCRKEMYVHPQLQITPLHLQAEGFQDTVMWFSFIAHTSKLDKLFDANIVECTKLKTNGTDLTSEAKAAGWNLQGKSLLSESYELPNANTMKVGVVDNGDQTMTVYIAWYDL